MNKTGRGPLTLFFFGSEGNGPQKKRGNKLQRKRGRDSIAPSF